MIMRFDAAAIATSLIWCIDTANAFQPSNHPSPPYSMADGIQCASFTSNANYNRKKNVLVTMSNNNSNNDDDFKGDFDLFEDENEKNDTGDELAQKFYQQLRIREEQKKNVEKRAEERPKDGQGNDNAPKDMQPKQQQEKTPEQPSKLSEDELRKRNRKAFLKRKEISVSRQKRRDGDDDNDGSKSSISSPSPSVEAIRFFSASKGVTGSGGQGSSLFSPEPTAPPSNNGNRRNNARQNMIQQEFNLLRIASSETAILIQIGLVVLLLVFELSIGINGGITDGSDRFGDEPNEFNGVGYDDENTIILQQQQKEDEDVEEILKNMSPSSGSVGGGSVWL